MRIGDRAKKRLPPVEPGVYVAVCVGVIDLGEQVSEKFKNSANKVQIVFELVGEEVEVDGTMQPRQLSREFAFSTSKKSNLRSFLGSWNGKNYSDDEFADLDIFGQLGKACQIQVVLNETGEYANIDSVMAIPKGFPTPMAKGELIAWDCEQWDDDAFLRLPEWVQEKIKKSLNYQREHVPTNDVAVSDEPAQEECPI